MFGRPAALYACLCFWGLVHQPGPGLFTSPTDQAVLLSPECAHARAYAYAHEHTTTRTHPSMHYCRYRLLGLQQQLEDPRSAPAGAARRLAMSFRYRARGGQGEGVRVRALRWVARKGEM